jgi:hypothetical protein
MKQDDDRIKELYMQSATEQPPAHLDDAILAASRKAVSAKCPRAPSRLLRSLTLPRPAAPFSGRWQLPVSLAAVLIVAVLLVPLLQEEQHEEERYDTATPVPSTVTPYETDLSAPSANMHQEVAVPKKYKARTRLETQAASEEAEQKQGLLLKEMAGDADVTGAPDQWLERIEALVDTGDETAAFAELQEFKRRYPVYPLPPGLEALWKKDR